MSRFVTKLRENKNIKGQTGRDGIDWPSAVGTWKQNENINRLETFAHNLDVSQAPGDTDLLNSVPTPWARLLLFESALYIDEHPAHQDVEDQWRGLLGVLALAAPLRLNLTIKSVKLSQYVNQNNSQIAKSFVDLRPDYQTGNGHDDFDKWNDFQMILVDDTVLGATSPRTLVFTGVAHRCPSPIPFRSDQGRLSDPVAYYKKFDDTFYLGLLARWLNGLISALENNKPLNLWMGTPPVAPGASETSRLQSLLTHLKAWQGELNDVTPGNVNLASSSAFTLQPYTVVTGLPAVMQPGKSDLFVSGRKDLIVYYRPESDSIIVNSAGRELVNEPLKVYDGRWIYANQPLPLPLNFLPDTVRKIEDPAALFEDRLIQVALPDKAEAVYSLSLGNEQASKKYLYPFKSEILDYFTPEEIANNTRIATNPLTNSLRVELEIPVENNRKIRAAHEYAVDSGVITDDETVTTELAAWPDFTCPTWTRYFYFKTSIAAPDKKVIDFKPLSPHISRGKSNQTWYGTREPVRAFLGSVDGKSGLLLLKSNKIDSPTAFWQASVDFGSTHTRAFYLRVDRHGDEKSGYSYVPSQGATIEPVQFAARAQPLTFTRPARFKETFFAFIGEVNPPVMSELKTLMMMPETDPNSMNDWLPREGYVHMHWIYDGLYNANNLHFNLKWNSHKNDYDLRAFLRCQLVMLQAEAIQQGARVVSVEHTYPSVFSAALKAKHEDEWRDLQSYLNLGVMDADSRVTVRPSNMTETVAVCRHLEWEQKASPVTNTISLDVGGSTTDMAVWSQKKLEIQESVKLAAGIIGRYLQSADAHEFLKWFESLIQAPPYNLRAFSLANFTNKPSGYSLMFTNLLSLLDLMGNLKGLVEQINAEPKARSLMSHIIYLFGSLLYYAGLLARRAGLPQQHDTYNIYFCGRGGTLVEWIHGYDVLAQEMFEAGLFGPEGRKEKESPTVNAKLSARPKEEVGRGLLAASELQGNPRGEQLGLVDTTPPFVTVGDTGYGNLLWNNELTSGALKQLPPNTVPAMNELKELMTFLETFKQGRVTRAAAVELGLHKVSSKSFQDQLLQRLFGSTKGSIVSDIKKGDDDALLEPLFITEIKVLLETVTPNISMFP